MKPLLAALAAVALLVTSPAAAQVVQVRNTGCPNAAYPTHNNTARIGKTFQFGWTCKNNDPAFAALGHQSGKGIQFFPPLTCVPGPCVWYPWTILFTFPVTGPVGNWSIPIPNNRALLFQTFSVQAGCFGTGCFTLGGALSFAIGP